MAFDSIQRLDTFKVMSNEAIYKEAAFEAALKRNYFCVQRGDILKPRIDLASSSVWAYYRRKATNSGPQRCERMG